MSDGALFDDSVGRTTWTVPELSVHVGRVLAGAFPEDLWVEGQIRNLSRSANGHVYFSLAEPAEAGRQPRTQLAVTLLAPERQAVNEQLKRAGGAVRMADGIEVRIQGRVRWYGPRGVVQLRMHGIDPAFTLGRLQADRDRILAELAADGLLERNASLAVPAVPLRIALITSRGSAAHADVLGELQSSGLSFTVLDHDARTQGIDASASITMALSAAALQQVDLVLLVRGGGARTDLAAFDTAAVARAIAQMDVPVFTGIGHEVDRSIADEVAGRAHKTPTAAAAAVVSQVRTFVDRVDAQAANLHRAVTRSLVVAADRLVDRSERTGRAAQRALRQDATALEDRARRLTMAAVRPLDRAERALAGPADAVATRSRRALDVAEQRLDGWAAQARAHDPSLVLARGWSITTDADGNLIRDAGQVEPGATLHTRLARGSVTSTATTSDPDLRKDGDP